MDLSKKDDKNITAMIIDRKFTKLYPIPILLSLLTFVL